MFEYTYARNGCQHNNAHFKLYYNFLFNVIGYMMYYKLFMFTQEDKVVQMYETMMTRHSTMLVGPTGGGKTVVMNALIKAQCHLGLPTKCTTLNPKVSCLSFIICLSVYMCMKIHCSKFLLPQIRFSFGCLDVV